MAVLTRSTPATRQRVRSPRARRRTELGLLVGATAIVVAVYVLVVEGESRTAPSDLGPLLAAIVALAACAHVANRIFAPNAHPAVLPVVFLLNGIGYAVLVRIDYATAHSFAPFQAAWTAVGVAGYVLTLVFVRRSRDLDRYRYLLLLAAVLLLLSPMVPHIGQDINGARLWIKLGPIQFQPIEVAKILLCLFFASYFAEKRELLSIPTARMGNRLVVDPRPLVPIAFAWLFAIAVMSLEHDIGFSALLFTLFIGMLWVTTGRTGYLVLGVVLFAVGAFLSAHLFAQTNVRIETWLDPWKVIPPNDPGYQLRLAWFSLGTGGIGGTGLGLGAAAYTIPNVQTDFIFTVIGEEMGLLGSTVIVVAFLLLVGAGLRIAQAARSEFAKLAATGLTLILGFQSFFILAGIARLLPLTGITLPFVSYGGSALVANYVLVALLMRISHEGGTAIDEAERHADERVAARRRALLAGPLGRPG
ncbi:MAG: FtsW/RodA/SpoVE family cell cycle protein [Actinomycetota bacterium]|nr:FtsW/RodA/SpoVE family cell cycle protein [Actinomycetota bacterium]